VTEIEMATTSDEARAALDDIEDLSDFGAAAKMTLSAYLDEVEAEMRLLRAEIEQLHDDAEASCTDPPADCSCSGCRYASERADRENAAEKATR